jgi:hypothetical protein
MIFEKRIYHILWFEQSGEYLTPPRENPSAKKLEASEGFQLGISGQLTCFS